MIILVILVKPCEIVQMCAKYYYLYLQRVSRLRLQI